MREISFETIAEYFPQIELVKDETVRASTLMAWQSFFENGNWEKIEDAYFMSVCPSYSLVEHTKFIVDISIKIAEAIEKQFCIQIDWDVLIASCLLHDVSKLMETAKDKDGYHENEIGQQYQHAFLSAAYAHEHGLPCNVVTNILTHTGDSKRAPVCIEGIILYYADMIDTDRIFLNLGKTLCIETLK